MDTSVSLGLIPSLFFLLSAFLIRHTDARIRKKTCKSFGGSFYERYLSEVKSEEDSLLATIKFFSSSNTMYTHKQKVHVLVEIELLRTALLILLASSIWFLIAYTVSWINYFPIEVEETKYVPPTLILYLMISFFGAVHLIYLIHRVVTSVDFPTWFHLWIRETTLRGFISRTFALLLHNTLSKPSI